MEGCPIGHEREEAGLLDHAELHGLSGRLCKVVYGHAGPAQLPCHGHFPTRGRVDDDLEWPTSSCGSVPSRLVVTGSEEAD